jgi:hypothetical protein
MDDVVAQVRKEQQQLRRQRAAIDARLAELETVLRVLPTLGVPLTTAIFDMREQGDNMVAVASVLTIKHQIIEGCQRLLADGKPRHTRDLVSYLQGQGIALKGKDPVLQVSAVLSKDKRFAASRKVGWTLQPQNGEGPGAPTPEPSDSRQMPLSTAVARQPHP